MKVQLDTSGRCIQRQKKLPVVFSYKKDCIILNSFCASSENEKDMHHCKFLFCFVQIKGKGTCI